MPRIRTIKPEFWTHPVIGKQDDSTRLMAIALLNYADDEGYFHAEPNLVRGFCRPFDDDSTITRRCLDTLSKVGYITVYDNAEYGQIGHIEKFSIHQKIDRPTPSKLKQYYSTKPRRDPNEPSLLDQGTGNREHINNEFIEIFNTITGKKIRVFDKKAKGQLNARLSEGFTMEDFKIAIEACRKDKYHIDNPQYLTPEFITRADKLQKYLNGFKKSEVKMPL